MTNLENFMETLTQEEYKIVQMGTIKTKDQALRVWFSKYSMGKLKSKTSKLPEKKKNQEKPKSNDASLNPSKEKEKKGKEKGK